MATGVARKNHLKPRSVRLAATDSAVRNGMPWRSAMALAVTRDARLVGADQRRHLLLGDQPQRLVLAGRRRALVVGEDQLDLGALQARQAAALGQRHDLGEIGIAVVDDVGAELDGHLGVVAGARRVAAQRIDDADLDGGSCAAAPVASPSTAAAAPATIVRRVVLIMRDSP